MTEQPAALFEGIKAGAKKPGAGKCEKCGFYKTWQYKVRNPTSGKMMPAHINTRDPAVQADVLGDGYCPTFPDNPGPQAPAAAPQGGIEKPVKPPAQDPIGPVVPKAAAPVTAEALFNVTAEDKRWLYIIRVAVQQAIIEEIRELTHVLKDIRDGKQRDAQGAVVSK